MKMIKPMAVVLLVLPTLVWAQASMPRVDQRQANQEQRIEQGEASGSLTQREANRLEKQQQHVDKLENKALADGTVTSQEKARLHHAQDVQNRRIYEQKHDRQHDFNQNGRVDRPRRLR